MAWLQEQLAARDAEVAALSEERDVDVLISRYTAASVDSDAIDRMSEEELKEYSEVVSEGCQHRSQHPVRHERRRPGLFPGPFRGPRPDLPRFSPVNPHGGIVAQHPRPADPDRAPTRPSGPGCDRGKAGTYG